MISPPHTKASDIDKHPGPEVGQQAVKTAPEEQDKGIGVSKSVSLEPQTQNACTSTQRAQDPATL